MRFATPKTSVISMDDKATNSYVDHGMSGVDTRVNWLASSCTIFGDDSSDDETANPRTNRAGSSSPKLREVGNDENRLVRAILDYEEEAEFEAGEEVQGKQKQESEEGESGEEDTEEEESSGDDDDDDHVTELEVYENLPSKDHSWCFRRNKEADSLIPIPLAELLEDGPPSVDACSSLLNLSYPADKLSWDFSAITEKARRVLVAIDIKAKTVHAVWSHNKQRWSYKSKAVVNQIPWVIHGPLQNAAPFEVSRLHKETFAPAPRLNDDDAPYPYFRYGIDTLYFRFERCSSQNKQAREHRRAMRAAIAVMEDHTLNHPTRTVHKIMITHCARADQVFKETLSWTSDLFRPITGLKQLYLITHSHRASQRVDDETFFDCEIRGGALKYSCCGFRTDFPFEVRLFDGSEKYEYEI